MNTLFPIEPVFPGGFTYEKDFLIVEEETHLVQLISGIELQNMQFKGYTAHRKTASFGYDYSFDNGALTKGKEIPGVFSDLINKVAAHLSMGYEEIAELLIIEYPPGSVINWHRDAPPFDVIIGISLNADCVFKLRPHAKEKQGRSSIISFTAERRSFYVISGEARTEWQHSIAPVNQTRYSITLRTLRQKVKS